MGEQNDVFLIFKVSQVESGRIRRLVHGQKWYSGSDVPVKQLGNCLGIGTATLVEQLEMFWNSWEAKAAEIRESAKRSNPGEQLVMIDISKVARYLYNQTEPIDGEDPFSEWDELTEQKRNLWEKRAVRFLEEVSR